MVRQVAVPFAARARSTLPRPDYEDAFVLETGAAHERTGEEWARALLEDAPAGMQRSLRRGWRALGLMLGSSRDALLVATFIQTRNPLARLVWAGVSPGHRQAVRDLLEGVAARTA